MRVKKLNANRRPKAGEDDSDSAQHRSPSQSPSKWASPTKETDADGNSYRRVEPIDVGADSPTDATAAPSVVQPHDVSELDLNSRYYSPSAMASAAPVSSSNHRNEPRSESPVPASWRQSVDRALRESVHEKIVEYLKTLKPNAPPKVLEKLPGLAYRMEEALFKLATSEIEYCDQTTLPQRLTLIQQANAKRLLQQQCPAVSPKDKDPTKPPAAAQVRKPLNEEQARVVFSCLQSWRQKLVNMYGATPWEILPNQILAKVAVFIPSTTQELVVCGVPNEQLERFGNSLLQEIEKIVNALKANASAAAVLAQQLARSASPSGNKRPSPSGGTSNGSTKTATSKRNGVETNKKRKTGSESVASTPPVGNVHLAAAPTSFLSPASFLSASQSLLRPMDPAFIAAAASAAASTSLPALLQSTPLQTSTTTASSSMNGKKLIAPATQALFPRIPVLDQDNRMHLLAQGVGQLSKQQEQQQQEQTKSLEAYEKEVQTLRWLLQESQREKAQLEAEVQRLRQQGAQ